MEHFERNLQLSDFTQIPFDLFKQVGIRLIKYHSEEEIPLGEKLRLGFVLATYSIHFFLVNAYPFLEVFSSPIELTAYACYGGFVANTLCKIIAVFNGRFILREVLHEMEKIFPRREKEIIDYRLEEQYKEIKLYMKYLAIYHFSTTTMFNLFPLIQSIFEYIIQGGDFQFRFPFIIYYPFDETRPIVYLFVYANQVIIAYCLSSMFLGSDLLLVSLVHIICMHLDYLTMWISNFEPNGTEENVNELKKFIQYHGNILSLSFKVNEVFNISILMNYIASCGVICMIAFQISMGTEILDLLKFFAFLVSSLVHVYFICHFGTNLLETSSELSVNIFSHRWYLGNSNYRKMLPLIIARAQKPAFLTAFKFFIISMESFKTLITTSYQFFTLIKPEHNEE